MVNCKIRKLLSFTTRLILHPPPSSLDCIQWLQHVSPQWGLQRNVVQLCSQQAAWVFGDIDLGQHSNSEPWLFQAVFSVNSSSSSAIFCRPALRITKNCSVCRYSKKKGELFSGNLLFISFLVSFHRIVAIHIFDILFTTPILSVFENSAVGYWTLEAWSVNDCGSLQN
jgi:hypothetical protein